MRSPRVDVATVEPVGMRLRAVIGQADGLDPVAQRCGVPPVELDGRWSLIPWTDDAFDALDPSDPDLEPAGLRYCHSALTGAMTEASFRAPLAYIEADSFGGQIEQGAVVFVAGEVVWSSHAGPILPPSRVRSPASEALSRIGVQRRGDLDEFDTIGLGRYRETKDWVRHTD